MTGYINREIYRKGMLTRKEAKIFEQHGFTIWGGDWKQPMDFMHFQIPRKLAEVLAATNKEQGAIIWENHLKLNEWHLRLQEKLMTVSKEKASAIWKEHLDKCQAGGGYLAAANSNDSAMVCLDDCRRKCSDLDAAKRKSSLNNKHKIIVKKRKGLRK